MVQGLRACTASSRGPKCESQHPHPVTHNHLSLQLQGNPTPLASMGPALSAQAHTGVHTYAHN